MAAIFWRVPAGRCSSCHIAEQLLEAGFMAVLNNARAIGEFGRCRWFPARFAAKHFRCRYRLNCWSRIYNTVGSFTAAALLTLMAIITLFLKSMLQWRLENQENARSREEHHEH